MQPWHIHRDCCLRRGGLAVLAQRTLVAVTIASDWLGVLEITKGRRSDNSFVSFSKEKEKEYCYCAALLSFSPSFFSCSFFFPASLIYSSYLCKYSPLWIWTHHGVSSRGEGKRGTGLSIHTYNIATKHWDFRFISKIKVFYVSTHFTRSNYQVFVIARLVYLTPWSYRFPLYINLLHSKNALRKIVKEP